MKTKGPSSSNEPTPYPISSLLVFLGLALLVGIVYANALDNGFIFDDYDLVANNPQIRSIEKIPEILGIGESPMRYRPVRFVSYALDSFLFGLKPWGYHLSNLFYHILTAFLVYLIVRNLVGSSRPALLAAALFAVHPIQTEAVTYISGRRDVLSTLFYLLGFYAFLQYRLRPQVRYLILICTALVLGLLTKEMVVTLPIMFLCYDFYIHFPDGHRTLDRSFFRSVFATIRNVLFKYKFLYGPMFLIAGLFLLDKIFIHNPSRMVGLYGSTLFLHVLTMCKIFVTYLTLLVFPVTLNADYSYNAFPLAESALDPWAWIAVAVLAGIGCALLKALQSHKILAFGGLWFCITLLPVSQIIPHHEPMAEHYLYLPSFGFCLLAALGAESLLRSASLRKYASVTVAAILLLLSWRTVVRNQDWHDDMSFWTKTVQTAPMSSRAHYNLGLAYFRQGGIDQAIGHYKDALRIWPNNPRVHTNLGTAYYAKGLFEQAVLEYRQAISIQPDFVKAHFNLGRVYGRQGKVDEALKAFQTAIRYEPRYVKAHHELGTAFYKKGMKTEAIEQYIRTLELDPHYKKAYRNLGIIYQGQGERAKAMEAYQALLKIDPLNAEAHFNLAGLYLGQGQIEKNRRQALFHFRQALKLAPHHPQAAAIRQLVDSLALEQK